MSERRFGTDAGDHDAGAKEAADAIQSALAAGLRGRSMLLRAPSCATWCSGLGLLRALELHSGALNEMAIIGGRRKWTAHEFYRIAGWRSRRDRRPRSATRRRRHAAGRQDDEAEVATLPSSCCRGATYR
jgi:hypothetical protein